MTHEKAAPARTALQSSRSKHSNQRIDFQAINAAALSMLPALLKRWLPDGYIKGNEWIALNPRRADQNAGSFKVNIRSGKWSDFATKDKGGDTISLAAYLSGTTPFEAALALMGTLGMENSHD